MLFAIKQRRFTKFILLFTVTVAFGCTKKSAVTPIATVPEELKLSPTNTTVVSGNTLTFTPTFLNNQGQQAPLPSSGISWSSSNTAIATINQNGVATGVSAGQVTITISYNTNVKGTALLTVTAAAVPERITLATASNSIIAGTTTSLTTTYFNTQGQQAPAPNAITYTSSNASVATVSSTGVITGVAVGAATITATLNAATTASISINVTANQERLVMSPGNANIMVTGTAMFTLTYFNNAGIAAPVPAGVTWVSNANTIATVNSTGLVTAVAAGSATITASVNAVTTAATVTVTANSTIATITLAPQAELELSPNTSGNVIATARDAAGNAITGVTFTFTSANPSIATVSNSGVVQGVAYGTANITAMANNIMSLPVPAAVVRSANFNGPFSAAGLVKIKVVNGVFRLQTGAGFSVSTGAPDLRIYLSNNTNSITDAIEVATLGQRTGAQDWAIPSVNTAGQTVMLGFNNYKYVLVWCKQFGGSYGLATLP
jgi:trimeric autotransporter adhesin